LGVAMSITTLIAVMGMFDSFLATIDDGEDEFLQAHPERMVVTLDTFYPVESAAVQAIQAAPVLSVAEPAMRLGGELIRDGETIDVSIELIDMNSELWTPTLDKGQIQSGSTGILITQKAADDLGVGVGDTITLKHPQREGLFAYRMVETEVEIAGIHASPLRFLTYMDLGQADMMGLGGLSNMLYVDPVAGVSAGEVQRALFQQSGVASVKAVAAITQMLRDRMDLFIGFMSIVVIAVLVLAFLIAFNSTSINIDERAREIATMFAFGLPIRTVTRMTMVENLITGVLGTLTGLGLGFLALVWMMNSRVTDMMPDVGMTITVYSRSLILAVILGVVVVALTPLLSIRKMSRMDLPSTLRVME
jgi:putative ABC transport system permease protein